MNPKESITNSKANSRKVRSTISILPDGTITYWHTEELEEALRKISTMDKNYEQEDLFIDGKKVTRGRLCG